MHTHPLDKPAYLLDVTLETVFDYIRIEDSNNVVRYYWFDAGGGLNHDTQLPASSAYIPNEVAPEGATPNFLQMQDDVATTFYLVPDPIFGVFIRESTLPPGVAWDVGPALTLRSIGLQATYQLTLDKILLGEPWKTEAAAAQNQQLPAFFSGGIRFPVIDGVLWRSRLQTILNTRTGYTVQPGILGGQFSARAGNITLALNDESVDPLMNFAWYGRPFRLLRGPANATTQSEFEEVLQGTIINTEWNEDRLSFVISEITQALQDPIQANSYLGTGQLEGGEDLAGTRKPLGYGAVLNAQPILVDRAFNVYQVHDGPIFVVVKVFDRGVEITPYAGNYADVYSWQPVPGQFVTDHARGIIRLGAPAIGPVTVDFQGDASETGYLGQLADIIPRILRTRTPLTDAEIDTAAFAQWKTVFPAIGSVYVTEERSVASVISDLAVGAVWGGTAHGLVTIRQVAFTAPVGIITEEILIDNDTIRRLPTPGFIWRLRFGYQKNNRIQTDTEVAAGAEDNRAAFAQTGYRTYTVADQSLRAPYLNALDVRRDTIMRHAGEARSEALRQFALLSVPRNLYRIQMRPVPFEINIGDTVTLQHSRFNLGAGQDFIVTEIVEQANARGQQVEEVVELTLWG